MTKLLINLWNAPWPKKFIPHGFQATRTVIGSQADFDDLDTEKELDIAIELVNTNIELINTPFYTTYLKPINSLIPDNFDNTQK